MGSLEQVGVIAVVKDFDKFNRRIGTMSNNVVGLGGSASAAGGGVGVMNAALTATVAIAAAAAAAVTAVAVGVGKIAIESVKTSISVESAFAGVAKTTDGLVDDFGKLTSEGSAIKQEFRDLSKIVPTSVEELMRIGEIAGQLGVQKEAIVGFSSAIADIGESTDLTTEAAATSLAKIQSVYGVVASDMVANTEKFGSAIVALGNSSNTNEPAIVDFATNIAGIGKVSGLSQANILGIATAFSSVGIEAQAGGTAVQKVLIEMGKSVATGNDSLGEFAKVAGVSAEEFKTMWDTDAAGAFQSFVVGLGDSGDDAYAILEKLELGDSRLIKSFISAGAASGKFADYMDLSNKAFEEGTALANEANIRYKTTESRISMLKNVFKDVGLTIGDTIKDSALFQKSLSKIEGIASSLSTSIGPLLKKMGWAFEAAGFAGLANLFGLPPETVKVIDNVQNKIKELFGIISGGGGVTDVLSALGLSDEQISIIETIGETGGKVFESLMETLGELKDNVMPFVNEQFTKISDWVDEHSEDIKSFIVLMGDNFIAASGAIADFWTVVEPILGGLVNMLLNAGAAVLALSEGDGAEAWEAFKNIGVSAWEGIKEAAIAFSEWVLSWFDTDWQELGEVWQSNWDNFLLIVSTVWDNITTTISTKFEEVKTAITTKVDEIKTSLQNKVSDFVTLGENFILGMATGVANKAGELISKVLASVQNAYDTAKEWLGVRSPSKLYASLGENMMLGLAEGIDQMSHVPIEASLNAVQQASVPATSSQSSVVNNTTNNYVNASYSQSQSPSSISDDLRLMAALS